MAVPTVTMRVPRRTSDWNPFVQPGDDVRRVEGLLREIDCSTQVTRILVETRRDRWHWRSRIPRACRCVMLRQNHVREQAGSPVTIVYAASKARENAAGSVRGIDFR